MTPRTRPGVSVGDRVRLVVNVPVEPRHGLYRDRVFEIRKVNRAGAWIQGKGTLVLIRPSEFYRLTEEG